MSNRKAAETLILDTLAKIDDNGPNRGIWAKKFSTMSDEAFEEFINALDSGEQTLHMFVPNQSQHGVDALRNIKIAKELGHDFFERLWLTDERTGKTFLTPKKYLVIDMIVRRQEQTLEKKISIPDHNRTIDDMTGQPTGDSKGSAISFPEFQILTSKDLDRSIEELFKVRGGDEKAFREQNRLILQTGEGSLDTLKQTPTRVRSTESLKCILLAMHMGNSL